MKNVVKPLAKCVLPLRLTAAAATDAAIHKKIFGSGRLLDIELHTATLIISNEEMNNIKKVVKSLEESVYWSKRTKRHISQYVIRYLRCNASLLGSLLTGKGRVKAGEGLIRTGPEF